MDFQARRDPLEHAQIEVDDVPAGEHVGIERSDARGEGLERGALGRAAAGALGHRPVAAVDDEHLVDAGREQRNRQQPLALGIRLDVEGQHARLDRDVGRAQHGIVEHRRRVRRRRPRASPSISQPPLMPRSIK